MKRIFIPISLFFLSASACNASELTRIPPIADGKRSYQAFISETKKFPYTIAENRKKRITSSFSELKNGMTKKEVSSIIGDPDFSEYVRPKEPPGKYKGSEWTYYFYKPDPNLVNEKLDRGLFLFFSTEDKLHWIVPKNIEGLIEKGSPVRNHS